MFCPERNNTGRPPPDTLKAVYKFWLEKDGAAFGDGLYNILMNVQKAGSISEAARVMGMSYRSAWGKIKAVEKRWRVSLVVTRVGGEMGGGAELTAGARELMDNYARLRLAVDELINKTFNDIFGGGMDP